MIVGYIRVSKIQQDLKNQKNAILEYANVKKWVVDTFIESETSSRKSKKDRKLDQVFDILKKGDVLIITELSRLGRSVSEVLDIVNSLVAKKVRLICIKENIDIEKKQTIQSKIMITMVGLFSELERDLVSQRTKEALALKKAQGIRLGRPKGPGKSKLDPKKDQIQEFLDKDVSMLSIAKILDVSYPTLFNFIKKRKMLKKSQKIQHKGKQNKTMRVKLSLRVWNNSKFVRGVKKSIESIEDHVLPEFDIDYEELGDNEYSWIVTYKDREDLDDQMYELLQEIASTADWKNCHTDETLIESLDTPDLHWE